MLRRSALSGLLLAPGLVAAGRPARGENGWMTTSDGVRLHVSDSGPTSGPALVLVPGWTMPGWIFRPQEQAFTRAGYRVVVLDPRGQGSSEVPAGGYDHLRRGADIGELIDRIGRPVVLVGWSLGVLDSLAYVQQRGDAALAGLVLIDNSVGEDPPPAPRTGARPSSPLLSREQRMRRFVRGMFRRSPGETYLAALTEASLRTPPDAAAALLSYPVPRSYWRDALYSVRRPVLYVVTPRFAAQAGNLRARHPSAEVRVFEDSGHALFVDDAAEFNDVLDDWLRRRVRRRMS